MTIKASDIPTREELAVQLYKEGHIIRGICHDLRMHPPELYDLLYKAGVPLRRPSKIPRKTYSTKHKRFNI